MQTGELYAFCYLRKMLMHTKQSWDNLNHPSVGMPSHIMNEYFPHHIGGKYWPQNST